MQIGTIDSVWRYPVKGMRGEEIPHTYTAFTGLMGDRVHGVVAADFGPGLGGVHSAGVLEDPALAGGHPDRTWRLGAQCRADVVAVHSPAREIR